MAQKNDERIMQLKETITKKREELAKKPTQFNPTTNCLLVLDKITYNLHVEDNTMLLLRLNLLVMSAKDLGINTSDIVISGYSLNDWMKDIKANIEVQNYKKKKNELDKLEKELTKLLSDDKQTELRIDEIAALINN